jgi:4-aminobutyrate aminotransferase/(S)-3-amino-2-methylpropionate transaminase
LGGTYGGNPVACAAGLAVLEVFEEESMLEKSVALGEKLNTRFKKWQNEFDIIGEVRGIGAMLGLEFVKGGNKEPAADEAKQMAAVCLEKGLLILVCGTYGNVVRILTPFVITDEQLEKGLSIMEAALKDIS